MMLVYVISVFLALKKPFTILVENSKTIKKMDNLIYNIITNKDIEESIIEDYYNRF